MKIITELLPVEQTGSNCKSVAIAAIDKKYAGDLNEPSFPLHKTDKYAFSIRQLAKRHGSVQGELLQIGQLKNILTDLGYDNNIQSFENYTDFLEQVQNSLQIGHLLIAFFAVNRKTREPSTEYDGGNEHAAIIHGIEKDEQQTLLHITHDGKNQTAPAELFFESTSVLPNERDPEYYFKTSNQRKYQLNQQQTDESLKWNSTIKSIIPIKDSGFKQKIIIVKKPTEKVLFKTKRKNLIDHIEFKVLHQTISTVEMKACLQQEKTSNALRLPPKLKNEMEMIFERYPSFLQSMKQEILALFENEQPDFSLIETKFNTLTSLLKPDKAVTQKGFFKRLRAAGYPIDEPGQCYGVAHMAMRAFLLGDMQLFLQRLHRIQHTPLSDFKDHLNTIKEKDKEKFLDFHAFFDYVMLLQRPYVYIGENNVFHNRTDIAQRKNHAYDLLENHENGPIEIGSLNIIYSHTELVEFFEDTKKHFEGVSFSLILAAHRHAINLNYIEEWDEWLLIDANNMPGHRYINTRFLVKQIMKSLFYQEGYIIVDTRFYSLKKNQANVRGCFNQFKYSVERSDTEYFERRTSDGCYLLKNSIEQYNWQEMCDLIFKGAVLCDEDMNNLLKIYKEYPSILGNILNIYSNPEELIDHLYKQLVYKNFNLLLRCIEWLITDKNKVYDYLKKKFYNLSDDAINKIHDHFDGFKCLRENGDFLINHIDRFASELKLHKYFVDFTSKFGCQSLDDMEKLALLKHTKFQPTIDVVHIMILNNDLDILLFYKNSGFIFKSEHLNALSNDLCEIYVEDIPLSFDILAFFWDMGIQPEASIIARLIRNNQVNELEKLKKLGFKFEFNHLTFFHDHYDTFSLSSEVLGFFWSMDIKPSDIMVYRLIDQNQLTAITQLNELGFIFNSKFLEHALIYNTSKIFLFLVNLKIKLDEKIIRQAILLNCNHANMAEHYPFFDAEHLNYALWGMSTSFILPLLKKNIQLNDNALLGNLVRSIESYLSDSDDLSNYPNEANKLKNECWNILEYLSEYRPDDYNRISVLLNPQQRLILSKQFSVNSNGLGFFSKKSSTYLPAASSMISNYCDGSNRVNTHPVF